MDDGFCVIDLIFDERGRPVDYWFVEVNPAFERQTGISQPMGRRARELFPGHEDLWAEVYGRVALTGESIRHVDFAGTLGRWSSVFALRVGGADSRKVALLFRDITERRRAERRAEFLAALSLGLAAATSEAEIVALTVESTGSHLDADRCYFVECRESEEPVFVSRNWRRAESSSLEGKHRLLDFGGREWWRQFSEGPLAVEDVASHALTREKSARHAAIGVRSYAAQPFRPEGEWTVALMVTETTPRKWTADDLSLLADVISRAWPMVERARADRALYERGRLAALRADVSLALVGTESLRAILQQCTAAIVAHVDAAFARIWTVNEVAGVLELQASSGQYTHLDGPHSRVKIGEFKIGRIAQSGLPLLTNDVQHDPNIGDPQWARNEGMVAFAGYPMLLEGRVLGVMAMFARQPLSPAILDELAILAAGISQWVLRKRAEENVNVQKRLLEGLTESVLDGILVVSPDGKMVHSNQRFRDIWNFPSEILDSKSDALALEWAAHQTAEPAAFLSRVNAVYAESDHPVREELPMMDGRVFERFGSPIRHGETRLGWVWTFRDISERKQAERTLRESAQTLELRVAERTVKLQETISELESFSYSISHDLRAPLRAMQSFAALLASDCGPQVGVEGKEYIHRIMTAADRMDRLIQDVLVYSRVARSEMPLERIELAGFIAGIVESYPQFDATHIEVEVVFPLTPVRANAAALTQCVSNLIGNAIRFGSPGVKPHMRIWTERQAPGKVILFFRDNGIGIAPNLHEKIFEMFQQLDPRRGGTGIGLAVVRKAAERMGGSVTVASEPGKGSTFRLELNSAFES